VNGRTKIITCRQTGRNVDGDNIVGMGWVQNILPCHPIVGMSRNKPFNKNVLKVPTSPKFKVSRLSHQP